MIHLAAEHYHHGWTAEELLRQHPDLRPEQVYAALLFFYDRYEDLVRQMQASAENAEVMRRAQTLSRDELLKRKAHKGGRDMSCPVYMDVHVPLPITRAMCDHRLSGNC